MPAALSRSSTDGSGSFPPPALGGFHSLVRRLARYLPDAFERHDPLARHGLKLGAEFRRVVGDELSTVARAADLDIEALLGGEVRVGAAQDMVAGGIGMPAIQHAGRWKTTAMVNRYGERLLAQRSGAAQLARLQHRE